MELSLRVCGCVWVLWVPGFVAPGFLRCTLSPCMVPHVTVSLNECLHTMSPGSVRCFPGARDPGSRAGHPSRSTKPHPPALPFRSHGHRRASGASHSCHSLILTGLVFPFPSVWRDLEAPRLWFMLVRCSAHGHEGMAAGLKNGDGAARPHTWKHRVPQGSSPSCSVSIRVFTAAVAAKLGLAATGILGDERP